MKMIIQPQVGCVICFREIHKTGATALRLKDPITPLPQGSGVTRQPWASSLSPWGQKKPQRHQSSHAISVATGSYTQSLLHFPKDITVSDFNLPLASGLHRSRFRNGSKPPDVDREHNCNQLALPLKL